ncbi:MAG: hypothetical protein RLZ10_1285, partial [Bacteroidota bacterium]
MKNTMNLFFSATILLSLNSCEKEKQPELLLPTNLTTTISHTSGDVQVQASASNANFYTFTFYENGDSTIIESQTGSATYTFQQSGTYQIKTKAHATYNDFVQKIDDVIIYVDSAATGAPTTGYSTPTSYPNYTLVWSDEFDGTALSSDWTYDIGTGNGGWGNNELQYYTNQNVQVSNGLLQITAKSETFNAQDY